MNKYDEPAFFEKYSQMSRSKEGLAGAGEWETFKEVLPDFQDKKVLDLGCGYGWHSVYASDNGAASVLGIDSSEKMLEVAREKTTAPNIKYRNQKIEEINFADENFDILLSSLVFHYIEEYRSLVKNIYRILKPDGTLIFTVEHPIFTAYGSQDWYYNDNGEILHFPVDNYYYEGEREAVFLDEKITKYHRTVTTYIDTLIQNDFLIEKVVEPMPPKYMKNEMRRPMMLIIKAKKKG